MVKIMSDTSTLFSIKQGIEEGVTIVPLCVTIDGKTYREFEEIDSFEFLGIIAEGHYPQSSQPALGDIIAAYEMFGDDEVINITMADGLSGTYETACAAREQVANRDKITVLNSRTLCGPQRHLVRKAVALARSGLAKVEILVSLESSMGTAKSFLIPADFEYQKRGGRLTPLAANMIGLLKVIPVLAQTEDGRRLAPHGIHRKFNAALKDIVGAFEKWGVGSDYLLTICHADNPTRAEQARAALASAFPSATIEVELLSPVFITQGGPGCISIQAIKK
ncbi:MAG: DegV family protein [Actinobacteria bacterium]|nr:DegV family protein [Actinomycetota bacterium]